MLVFNKDWRFFNKHLQRWFLLLWNILTLKSWPSLWCSEGDHQFRHARPMRKRNSTELSKTPFNLTFFFFGIFKLEYNSHHQWRMAWIAAPEASPTLIHITGWRSLTLPEGEENSRIGTWLLSLKKKKKKFKVPDWTWVAEECRGFSLFILRKSREQPNPETKTESQSHFPGVLLLKNLPLPCCWV